MTPRSDRPSPAPDATDVSPTVVVSSAISGVKTASITVTGPAGDVPGASSLDPDSGVVSFSSTEPLEWATDYRAQVTGDGIAVTEWRFTTAAVPVIDGYETFFPAPVPSDAAGHSEQVGIRFNSSVDGAVSALRVYVGPDADASHTGYLWGPEETLLATVTFTGDAVNGWRTGSVSPAVDLIADTEYRVTIHSSSGEYARMPDALTSASENGYLSLSESAGVYGYRYPDQETIDGFPVDVLFSPKS